ncbi:MAG TPA: SRPBCC family protein [Nocardia sp.]|uniref:SRPBCC family protein n=1 Tax=Nocardia TaxID=1817 RepID=UPI002453EB24|nr:MULTISPECIES: SRPBCC family protein [Nocardia]HLS77888.1 SRPBCC family protein [Nocardia sp.]
MAENLEATVDIVAPPSTVWQIVGDPARMPDFSPTTRAMKPLGAPKAGTWTVNWNKVGWKVYPSTSRIVAYEPERELAFRMNENGVTWRFRLEPTANGTRLTQVRDASNGVRWPVRKAIDLLFGGEKAFEQELLAGMTETLARIKAAAETAN